MPEVIIKIKSKKGKKHEIFKSRSGNTGSLYAGKLSENRETPLPCKKSLM